ncbi:unnamed protein product [Peniophora sp. CBMAI 1063]|nr:unnamed protein product [Peniophora sp. CBMAI 1063]
MARPRESLLDMFDPLVGMTTPSGSSPSAPRESGELSSSDKENASPMTSRGSKSGALTMTKFFDRTYSKQKAPPKPLPKGALIDYDVSMMSDDSMDASTEGDDGKYFDEEEDGENAGVQQSPVAVTPRRRVLGDIRLDQAATTPTGLLDATPLGFRAIPAPVFGASSPSQAASMATVNYRSDAASLPSSPEPPATPPSINVSPPDVGVSTLSPAQQSHSSPGLTRRPSLDLHTSFNMSMNLRDTSFDILNDRISFVGCDSMLSNEDFDVDLHVPSFAANNEEPPTTEDESDRGGLADESDSASEADLRGSLSERLADVRLDEDSEDEGENENAASRANLAALATPKPQTVSSAPKAPHVSKHYTGPVQTRLAPAVPEGHARLLARGHIVPPAAAPAQSTTSTSTIDANATTDVPTTKPSVAALRVVKKPQLARRASLAPASRVSPPGSSATSRSGTPSGQETRAPSPATRAPSVAVRPRVFVAPSQAQTNVAANKAAAPARPRTSVAPTSSAGVMRPTKASLLKGSAAARVPAARPSVTSSTLASSKLQRAPSTTGPARVPVKPTTSTTQALKTSGLRAPSRFGAPTASSAARKPAASSTAPAAPVRDVAKILRGPAPKRA